MKKHKIARIEGYGRLTGPAQDGMHTVEVTAAGGETSQVQGEERDSGHRLRGQNAPRPRSRTTAS